MIGLLFVLLGEAMHLHSESSNALLNPVLLVASEVLLAELALLKFTGARLIMDFLLRYVDYHTAFIGTWAQGDGALLLNVQLELIERDLTILFTFVRARESGAIKHLLNLRVDMTGFVELATIATGSAARAIFVAAYNACERIALAALAWLDGDTGAGDTLVF